MKENTHCASEWLGDVACCHIKSPLNKEIRYFASVGGMLKRLGGHLERDRRAFVLCTLSFHNEFCCLWSHESTTIVHDRPHFVEIFAER